MRRMCVVTSLLISVLLIVGTTMGADEKPSFDLNWYGHIKLDGAFDQNLTSHGDFVMWVEPQTVGEDDDQFNMTANDTRFGFEAIGSGYKSVQVGGKVEFDLYGSGPGNPIGQNEPALQLRHAYFNIQFDNTKLLAGQSWDLISPLNPPTLNYASMWGCGNLGYLRPQVSLWYNLPSNGQTDVTLAGGFFRNFGSDVTPTFSLAAGEINEDEDDGIDAGIPSIQGLFDLKHELASGRQMRVGFSVLWGMLKAETNLGNSQKYESWAVVGHFMMSFLNGSGFAAEAFTGSNLGSYFGGILRNSTIDGLNATGGWVSGWVKASPKVELAAGFGMDNPDDSDFTSGRSRNTCFFGNVRYYFVPQAAVGFELSRWETKYKGDETAKNLRAQTSFVLNF
ncbi:MAG: hypothetical protein ACE5K8_00840 [Candidatus Zixiibacteriota bacterium]